MKGRKSKAVLEIERQLEIVRYNERTAYEAYTKELVRRQALEQVLAVLETQK